MADDYKLKVGLDANIYLQKATLEKELRMLQRDLKFAEKNLSIEIQAEVLADINKVKSQLKAIDSEVQKSASSWGGFMKNALSAGLGNILSQVANNISSFFKNALNKSIELSDQLERNKIAFTTMLGGDENEANKFLNQLDTFSNKYAKNRQEVRENAKQMMAMGVKYEKVIPTMKALGDVQSALGVEFSRLTYNYGQVISQGYLNGRDLRDFANAGVPLLETLSEMLGKTSSEIKDMVENGEISAEMVEQAFMKMTEEGGKFADMMKQTADTRTGLRTQAENTLQVIIEKVGGILLPVLKDALFWINSLFDTPDTNLKQNIADLKSEIHELSKEVAGIDKDMAELNQQFREGKLSSSEYTESIVKLIEEKRRLDGIIQKANENLEKEEYLQETLATSADYYSQKIIELGEEYDELLAKQEDLDKSDKNYLKNRQDIHKQLEENKQKQTELTSSYTLLKTHIENTTGSTKDLKEIQEEINNMIFDPSSSIDAMDKEAKAARSETMAMISLAKAKLLALEVQQKNLGEGNIFEKSWKSFRNFMNVNGTINDQIEAEQEKLESLNKELLDLEISLENTAGGASALGDAFKEINVDTKLPKTPSGGSPKADDKEKKQQEELIKQAEAFAQKRIQLAKDTGRNEAEVAKEVAKIQEELEIEILTIKGDTLKIEEKMNKKREEAVKAEKKGYDDLQKAIVDGVNEKLKEIDRYKAKIEETEKKIEDVKKKWQEVRKEQEQTIKDIGRDLNQLETDKQISLEDRRAELEKQSSSGDGFEGREREEYIKLEQQLTWEQKQQAKIRRDMTDTEKLLLDYEKEKTELQEKMALASRIASVEDQTAVIKQKQGDDGQWKTYYEDEKGELIEIQNLKNIQYAEGIMQKQNELLAEQEKLEVEKQNYQNHLADETKEYEKFKTAREYLEESFTKRFGEEMQKQEDKAVSTLNTIINKYRELALMQHEANMANFQQQVLHNAYGGAVPKGRLTVVGENGPEALVARASSYVQPSNAVNTVHNNSNTYNSIAMGGMYFNNIDDMLEELRRRLSMHF